MPLSTVPVPVGGLLFLNTLCPKVSEAPGLGHSTVTDCSVWLGGVFTHSPFQEGLSYQPACISIPVG